MIKKLTIARRLTLGFALLVGLNAIAAILSATVVPRPNTDGFGRITGREAR